jgi:ATP-dependent DNA helicase RecG
MIELCRDAGLPAPDFELRQGSFVLTLWRDWITNEALAGFELNERQLLAVAWIKKHGRITNTDYQELASVAKRTAHRDLFEMLEKGVVDKLGTTGKGVAYRLTKGATKGPKGPST